MEFLIDAMINSYGFYYGKRQISMTEMNTMDLLSIQTQLYYKPQFLTSWR